MAGERRAGDQCAEEHERDRDPRQRPPGRFRWHLELDLDLPGQGRPELPHPTVENAQAPDHLLENDRGIGRRMGGMELAQLLGHLDRMAEALETLLRGESLGAQALGLAGLFEDRAAFG